MIFSPSRLGSMPSPNLVRRVQRLAWFGLTACVVIVGVSAACGLESLLQAGDRLAILVILVSTWAIVAQVSSYAQGEQERLSTLEASARRETAIAMARLAKDRVKNKLSLVAGYSEFVVSDPRLPADLRDSAQRALDGAFAAARAI